MRFPLLFLLVMHGINIQEYTAGTFSAHHTHFLQSPLWAEFKKTQGWLYRCYEVSSAHEASFLLTVLLRDISPFGLCAYIPMGPPVLTGVQCSEQAEDAEKQGTFLAELAEQLVPLLPSCVFLIRFDPPWGCASKNEKGGTSLHVFPLIPYAHGTRYRLRKAPVTIQPPDTVCLDLQEPLDALLADCKPKWRYNIRLAQKKGVCVRTFAEKDAEQAVPIFYALYRETAVRDGIAIHAQTYYEALCRLAAESIGTASPTRVSVYVAYFEERPLASIITLFSGHEAFYLYGASSNVNRNLMPAYLLQWQAIQDAKSYGCLTYDFYGIPPTDDPHHPMHGLFRFKTGFGGTIIHRVGALDIPIKNLRYCAYAGAEKARNFWYKRIKKKL